MKAGRLKVTDYKVVLSSTGPMTQVPDSQKLFGALTYLFAERYGEDVATDFTQGLLKKETHVALSNIMPLGFLPTPHEYLIGKLQDEKPQGQNVMQAQTDKAQADNAKQNRSAIKEKNYIDRKTLQEALANVRKCIEPITYIKAQTSQQLRASIQSVRYEIPELDTITYSVPTVSLTRIWSNTKRSEPVEKFCFYVQLDEDWAGVRLKKLLEEVTRTRETIILGKRASQGLNTFAFDRMVEIDLKRSSRPFYLNTGMLLPDQIDFSASTLKLYTSERRPFQMPGGWDDHCPKQFISFISEGSIIHAPGGIKNTGTCIPSPYHGGIVFGNAFMYPISLREGM